jgi:hypothetical protein
MFTHLHHKLGFATGLEPEIEIIADDPAIYLDDPVSRLEFQFGSKAVRANFRYLNTAAPNARDCRGYCKFIHDGIMSDKLRFVERVRYAHVASETSRKKPAYPRTFQYEWRQIGAIKRRTPDVVGVAPDSNQPL